MNINTYLEHYFDTILDREELNEILLKWLIDEAVIDGPINRFEDAEVMEINILDSCYTFEDIGLVIRADYAVKITYFYVNDDEQDCSFLTEFELEGKFVFTEKESSVKEDELVITYCVSEARPIDRIELQQYINLS